MGFQFKQRNSTETTFSHQVNLEADVFSFNINEHVLYAPKPYENFLSTPDLKGFIRQNFIPNRKPDMIFIGKASNHRVGWIYTQFINHSDSIQKLVLGISNEHCDEVKAYSINNENPTFLSSVARSTPLSDRFMPYLEYALPITVAAKDTLNLLLETNRYFGVHEVSVVVMDINTYLDTALYRSLLQFFQGVGFLSITLVTFILGFVFKEKKILYLCLYVLIEGLFFAAHNQLFDNWQIAQFIGGGNPGTIEVCFIFLINAFFHPFGYGILKPYLPKKGSYWKYARLIMWVNLIAACLMLLPAPLFEWYMPIAVYALWGLVILNVMWMFSAACWLYLSTGLLWYLMIWVVALLPLLARIILQSFTVKDTKGTMLLSSEESILPFFAIAILVIYQFTKDLMHKKKADQNLQKLQSSLEDLRKSEIERIGRNLHDQVGNTLATALGYLNAQKDYTEKAKEMIHVAISDLRFTSHNLVKDNEDILTDKVSLLVNRFNDFSTVNFKFEDYSEGKINQLSGLKQQNLYSIIQELLTNIIKHAGAKESYIQIFYAANEYQIMVEDDGRGFPRSNKDGIGISNIHKRAALSGFKVSIDSSPNGTSIIIEIKDK